MDLNKLKQAKTPEQFRELTIDVLAEIDRLIESPFHDDAKDLEWKHIRDEFVLLGDKAKTL